MNRAQRTLGVFLHELDVNVPNSVIRRMLDTPVGTSLRGISDALDSLNIDNNVYQLPVDYLKELNYPYVMVLSRQDDIFAVITNDNDKNKALPDWDGIVLAAQKTNKTPIFKYIWLRDAIDRIVSYWKELIVAVLAIVSIILYWPDCIAVFHVILSCLAICISISLLKKDYSKSNDLSRYCKIGNFIDCEIVLGSKGSQILGIFRMSDLAFLFFSTELLICMIHSDGWLGCSFLLLLVGCCFVIYSILYQVIVVHKICLYCMAINLITLLDTVQLFLGKEIQDLDIQTSLLVIWPGVIAYIIWYAVTRDMFLTSQVSSLKDRVSVLYKRELFDWLLSCERMIDPIDDRYAEVGGQGENDIITIFVHPNCRNCKGIYQYIPELRENAIVKIVSLASTDIQLHKYCEKNRITKTPTVFFNNRELPEFYSVEDLKYLI